MANTNTLVTELNTSPYYDDFDESKNYHRILFNPGLAVQARELTQMQTILQNQVDRHAEHVFAEGAIVKNGKINIDFYSSFIKVEDDDVFGNPLNLSELVGTTLTSSNTGLTSIVTHYLNGSEAEAPDTKTLYIKYTSSGTDGVTKKYANNDTITSNTGINFKVINTNNVVGDGVIMTITDGVLYAKDHFIRFDEQKVVLSKYNQRPTCKAGFIVEENIVNSNDDFTLLDPAAGSFNYAAPGADRLQLIPRLVVYQDGDTIPDDFIQLLDIREGVINKIVNKTEYGVIKDEFARRTYDESGDYSVQGLKIRLREHLNNGTNAGYLTSVNGGNSSLLAVGVEPGKAYIKGYEIEKLVTEYISIDKGIDYKTVETQSIAANYGNYIKVNEVVGDWNVNDGITITLHDDYDRKISSRSYSGSPVGNQIGTAILKTMEYESGMHGANNAIFRAHLTNVQMTSGSFSQVKAIHYNNGSTADASADVYGPAVLQEKNFDTSIYKIPTQNIKTIRDELGNVETTFTFKKKFDVSIATTGTFTLNTGSANEIFPFGLGNLNATQKKQNFILVFNAATTVAMSGTISVAGTTVTGSGTSFNTGLNVGDKILITATGDVRTIKTIASATSMTIDEAPSGAVSGSAFSKRYLVGDIVDLGVNGATGGTERTVEITSSTSASFDLKETLADTISASIMVNLRKTEAKEIKKIVRKNAFVKLRISTNPKGTTGPWNLGLSDVIKINSVRKKSSAFTSATDGTLVTSSFTLDNGQRDNFYDHAKLMKRNASVSVASGDYLLINLDYFEHDNTQGAGYYSVDSYPIDDVNGSANTNAIMTQQIPLYRSTVTGETYNLRDCIDTRFAKVNTAAYAATYSSATENPTTTTSFNVPAGGLRVATPNEDFVVDYSYYLPRKDLIIVDKLGVIRSIRGVPSLIPAMPDNNEESMILSVIDVAPYPSLPSSVAVGANRPQYANKVQNVAIKRYTMKDIGVLEQRIANLEYYVTLSMLEKDTFDTKIVDENGLDRFKNGILVDPFNDHGVGDLANPDYSIAVDRTLSEIRPKFVMGDMPMTYKSSTGLLKSGSILTRPYTEVIEIDQPYATTERNAAGLFYNYVGELFLDPNNDYWVDTKKLPDLQINDNTNLENWQQLADAWGTEWGSWETSIVGKTVTTGKTTSTTSSTRLGSATVNSTTTTTSGGGVTTTTTQKREGQQLVVESSTQTENYGERVVDVSVIPFIRQQKVKFHGTGFKPSSRLYAFFDGEDVTAYCKLTNSSYAVTSSTLKTDSNGQIYGIFTIPNNNQIKFRTGTKTFRLTDSSTNETEIGLLTTSGQTTFTASGLNQTKQNTIVTTEVPEISSKTVVEKRTTSTFSPNPTTSTTTRDVIPDPVNPVTRVRGRREGGERGGDPIAQSFKINAGISAGVFATGVGIYFSGKHSIYGAIIELREMNTAGFLTDKIVPGTRVRVAPSAINVSATAALETKVAFNSPVFLMNNTEYAVVVKPEADNPDTKVWVAKLGREDITTGVKISKQPHTGQLFASSNDSAYVPIPDEDMKFHLYAADFTVGSGTATFVNAPTEFMTLSSTSGEFEDIAETIYGETRFTVTDVVGGTIGLTDILVGTTSGATGIITDATAPTYRAKEVYTDFIAGEPFSLRYANNDPKGVTGTIATAYKPLGVLINYDGIDSNTAEMDIRRTNSYDIVVGEELRGETSNNFCTVGSFRVKKVNLINPQSSQIVLLNTSVGWEVQSTSNTGAVSGWVKLPINRNHTFNSEQVIYSNSVTPESFKLRATLTTAANDVSPVVNAGRTHSVFVHNIINNDATDEDKNQGGNSLTKYITRKVTLAEGQDAEDLKVYVTGYRPPTTDIKVYAKFLNAGDSDTFDDINWKELTLSSRSLYSDTENLMDFKEFEFSVPDSMLTGDNDEIQYTNSNGVVFTGYKYFSIKIVLLGANSVRVPRCKDMRAICLQR